MSSHLSTSLVETLLPHFSISKSRLVTLAILVIGLVNGRTVNLGHIASQFPGEAKHASNYRRLQRFFQHVRLDPDRIALIVVRMLKLVKPKVPALDRTNWKVGSKDVNVLVLAIVTRRFRVPVLWTMLAHSGSSNTEQRIALMQRYLNLFGASSIKLLLADREFIGVDWIKFLHENNIPFAIRIRYEMCFVLDNVGPWSFKTLLRGRRARKVALTWTGWLPGMDRNPENRRGAVAKKLKSDEWLIILTNMANPKQALNAYRKRWIIECLFGDTKTRGLNMEDTHIVNPDKISTLLAIITLAITWAYRCATQIMGYKAVKRKTHGRREKSWFRIGFDALRNWIINKPDKAKQAWATTCPKRLRRE